MTLKVYTKRLAATNMGPGPTSSREHILRREPQ